MTVSVKDKLNLSIGVAVGSSIVSLVIVYFQKVTKRLYSKLLSSLFRMAQYILFPKHILTGFFFSLKRFIVTLGWILNKPLTLLFDPYESISMFLAGNWFLSYPCML